MIMGSATDRITEEQPKMSDACIWSIYNVQAENHDKQLMERWIGQSHCTLNFVRRLCVLSILRPDSWSLRRRGCSPLSCQRSYSEPTCSNRIRQTCYSIKSTSRSPARSTRLPFSTSSPFVPAHLRSSCRRCGPSVSSSASHVHSARFWCSSGVRNICDIHSAIPNLRRAQGSELICSTGVATTTWSK